MRWAIVGSGVLGTALAIRLAHEGHDVTIYEAAPQLGGLADAWELGGVRWDRHYHVTLLSDSRTRSFYESLGLGNSLRWSRTRTGYYGADRELRSVSTPAEFLKIPDLNALDKTRLAGTLAYASLVRAGTRMERISVERWLRRWSGNSAFDGFWLPLLRAKMGDGYQKASAAFIWATVRRLTAARRNGLEDEKFGYVSGGYARVFDAAEQHLTDLGVKTRTSTTVRSIVTDNGQLAVASDTDVERMDRVVVTTSSRLAARMCPDLLANERRRLEQVDYVGIVCVSLLLTQPLAEYYLTYITDPSAPYTAVVEMTTLIDPAEVGGHTLVYLPKYLDEHDELLHLNDDEIVERFLHYLESMYPRFERNHVIASRVSRVRDVFAIPTLDYSSRAPSVATSVPGLYIAGSANLPFSTLNVNDTLSLVEQLMTVSSATDLAAQESATESTIVLEAT